MAPLANAGAARCDRIGSVDASVAAAFPAAVRINPRTWTVDVGGQTLEIALGDHWLDVVLRLSSAPARPPLEELAANAELAAPLKRAHQGGAPCVAAAIPLDNLPSLPARLQSAAAAIEQFLARRPCRAAAQEAVDPDVLRPLVAASGWTVVAAKGALRIEVECGDRALLATVAPHLGGVAVRLDLPALQAASSTVERQALAALLWRVNGTVRLVRILLDPVAGALRPTIEVHLAATPTQGDVIQLFAAITIAARMCAREAELLDGDPRLARLYLDRIAAPRGAATTTRAF